MMNYCDKCFDSIDDLVEGELNERAAEQISSHISVCLKCRAHYDALRREKEIYAHYLFETDPPVDLRGNFQARLAAEQEKTVAVAPTIVAARKTKVFSFPRFVSLFAGAAALLVAFAIAWLKFAPNAITGNDDYAARTERSASPPTPKSDAAEDSQTTASTENVKAAEKYVPEKNGPDKILKSKSVFAAAAAKKPIAVEALKITRKTLSAETEKNRVDRDESNAEERARERLRLQNLETEIAGQIERVELLLRAFRNTRANEEAEIFDVSYEKTQARKLLEKNARLRQIAEDNGIAYAEELLSRVEPYLLDIANLEDRPATGEVLDIKERVSNRNIIASLQIY